MNKKQLADIEGISVRTLMRWCEPFRQELTVMGLRLRAKKLPPHIVAFLSEKFCIDVE